MKKTIMKTTMLAAIASLTMSGYALAHHPLLDFNPDLYDQIDAVLSETNSLHNEIMDARLEDDDMMTSTSRSMDANEDPTTASDDPVTSRAASQTSMTGSNPAANTNLTGRSARAAAGR
ncbi:MAG: hypothetical protein ABFS39_15205 [Pseudomonadota bacterium]